MIDYRSYFRRVDQLQAFPDYALRAASDPTLADHDHFMCNGDDRWYSVGEVRALQPPGTLRTAQTEETHMNNDTPDPYASGLAALRANTSTPEQRFEDAYRASRLRDLEATRASLDAEEPRVLSAEQQKTYPIPDPYAAGLAHMRRDRGHR